MRIRKRKSAARVAVTERSGVQVILAKPLTYVNESGIAAKGLRRAYGLLPGEILVICDDLNLPLGTVRLRRGGNHGGHRGLISVEEHLATDAFPRLRVGIGAPEPGADVVEFVLSAFGSDELPSVEAAVARAADCVEKALQDGLEAAMNLFNRRPEEAP